MRGIAGATHFSNDGQWTIQSVERGWNQLYGRNRLVGEFPTIYSLRLRVAIAVGGDVDTVGAMAGAMAGAAVVQRVAIAVGGRWAQLLNDRGAFRVEDLTAIARAVHWR